MRHEVDLSASFSLSSTRSLGEENQRVPQIRANLHAT